MEEPSWGEMLDFLGQEQKDLVKSWWKEKATRRFTKLYKEGRLSKDVLWYKDMKEDEVNSYLMSQGIKIS